MPMCAVGRAPLPEWRTLPVSHVVLKLNAREANAPFFRDLAHVLASVASMADDPRLAPLARQLMPPTNLEAGLNLELAELGAACRPALAILNIARH